MNKTLKRIAQAAGLTTRLTFHVSRHSFAAYALRAGWSVRMIQAALGHSNIRVTEGYLQDIDATFAGRELSKLFEKPPAATD